VFAAAKECIVLHVEDVRCHYGRIEALHGVSLEVAKGEIVALLGNNGAGKTTLLRAISGVAPITSGAIRFQGEVIDRTPAHRRVKRGIAQVPEGRQIFAPLAVEDNLRLGAFCWRDAETGNAIDRIYGMFPVLAAKRRLPAGSLSGGEQQMLAIGRALMSRPQLLMLDEPSMGLAPILVERIYETIAEINRQGTTILLVEQNANFALEISSRGYVLETGRVVLTDAAGSLRENDDVKKAYLGI
jgi:branched-chain amino acid transport system ATP-binding protein